jgi:protein-disulfide isomerase
VAPDRSPVETPRLVPFPSKLTTALPAAVQSKLDAGRPMLIFFFDSSEPETTEQRGEIDAVVREYRGLIDLVTFDVKGGATGQSTDAAKQAATLATDLGVKATPYIIVVDRNGFITWRWLGFVDRDVIEREVLRATQ